MLLDRVRRHHAERPAIDDIRIVAPSCDAGIRYIFWKEVLGPETRVAFSDVSRPCGFPITGQAVDEDDAGVFERQ